MAIDVEFWDHIFDGVKNRQRKLHFLWELRDPFLHVARPLASDVIRKRQRHRFRVVHQRRQYDEIHIGISSTGASAFGHYIERMQTLTFPPSANRLAHFCAPTNAGHR